MDYAVEYDEKAIKDLDALDRPIAQRIVRTIGQKLTTAPLEHGSRLKYYKDTYKLRVGDYKVVYKVNIKGKKVFIAVIGDRKEIYEILKRRFG